MLITAALAGPLPPPPPIVNGELEEGMDPAVALGLDLGAQSFSACTGTLITPRLVLSAAHCGADLPEEALIELGSVFFGPDIRDTDMIVGIAGLEVHPDYVPLAVGTLGAFDLGVIELDEDAPVEPAWVFLGDLSTVAQDETLLSVGFGNTSGNGGADGRKRSAEVVIDDVTEMFLITRSDTNPGGGNICSGDSGGPQFKILEDGSPELWAVHSWGDVGCESQGGSTRLDVDPEWLLDQVERVHGTRDFCEANGRYGDGVCDAERCTDDPDCAVAKTESPASGCSAIPMTASLIWGLAALGVGTRRRRA